MKLCSLERWLSHRGTMSLTSTTGMRSRTRGGERSRGNTSSGRLPWTRMKRSPITIWDGSTRLREKQERAVVRYRQALGLDPELVRAWNNLGNSLVQLGQPALADQAYEQALALSPEHPSSLFNLGTLRLEQGASDRGLPFALRYLALRPMDLSSRKRIAELLIAGSRPEAARRVLVDAPDLDGRGLEILARLHWQVGEEVAAVDTAGDSSRPIPTPRTVATISRGCSRPRVKSLCVTCPRRWNSRAGQPRRRKGETPTCSIHSRRRWLQAVISMRRSGRSRVRSSRRMRRGGAIWCRCSKSAPRATDGARSFVAGMTGSGRRRREP